MSRVIAFHTLKASIQDAQDGADPYKEALWSLIHYAAQLKAYGWPSLSKQSKPEGWEDAQDTWAKMTGTLSGWSESTLNNVIALPTYLILESAQVIEPGLESSLKLVGLLIDDANNTEAKTALIKYKLPTLAIDFNEFSKKTTALIQSLESQKSVFDDDAKTLRTIADKAVKWADVDQGLIDDLNNQIEDLRDDIKTQTKTMVGGSLVAVIGVTMGVFAIALAGATGGASLVLLLPAAVAAGAGTYIIIKAAGKMKEDKDKIDDLIGNIGDLKKDITLFNQMTTDLNKFAGQVNGLKDALSVVIQPWQKAEDYFTHTIATLNEIENATSEDWKQVHDELQQIQTDWSALMTTVNQLRLDAMVSPNAQLELGMDENQVKTALDNSQLVSLSDYLAA